MLNLFDLDSDLLAIIEDISETGEISDEQDARMNALLDGREDKADAYAYILKTLAATEKAADEAGGALEKKRTAAKNAQERLKARLLQSMTRHGQTEMKGKLFTIRRQRSRSEAVVLREGVTPADLPAQFRTAPTADKTALKAALKAGDALASDLAAIEERSSEHVRVY
jgi:hypothetical protein